MTTGAFMIEKAPRLVASCQPPECQWNSGMGRPLLSVGIPVYNSEQCIGDAIESIQAQTYKNVEIVICDNCSTDRTREICLRYAASDERIRYHQNTTDIGKEPNFLRVLQLATGDFFMWNCADDIRPAGSLEGLMAAMLRSPQAVMAHGPVIAEAIESTKVLANRMNLMKDSPSERIREYVKGVEHNAIQYSVYKTKTLKRAYVTTDFNLNRYGHDFHLCLQTCLLGPVECISTPMIIYKERGVHPTCDPMGKGRPVTLWNVLTVGEAIVKAWTTFLHGCYHLLKPREVPLSDRLRSLYAFGITFLRRYKGRLLSDGILIAALPVRWFVSWVWPLACRSSVLVALGRKVRTRTFNP